MNNNEQEKNIIIPENESNNVPVTPITTEEENIAVVEQTKLENQVNTSTSTGTSINSQQVVQPINPTNTVKDNSNVPPVSPVPNNTPPVQPIDNNSNNSNNKGPSTFAKVMTTLLFIFLFLFVYFLGDITDFINEKKLEKQTSEITSGKLVCSNEKTTENLDVKINASFTFENKQITGLTFITTSTGDKTKDKKELEELKAQCDLLKEETNDYDGISVVCSLNNGINSTKQIFDYATLNVESVRAAYSEAGGVYPQFKYKDDINSVESKMISSDYTCEKSSF